jgi:hypothetical protein
MSSDLEGRDLQKPGIYLNLSAETPDFRNELLITAANFLYYHKIKDITTWMKIVVEVLEALSIWLDAYEAVSIHLPEKWRNEISSVPINMFPDYYLYSKRGNERSVQR